MTKLKPWMGWAVIIAASAVSFYAGYARASEAYVLETRQWALCTEQSVAESIGKIYEEQGGEPAFWTWEQATKHDLCFYRYAPMTPLEVTFKARDLKVIRVRDDAGKDWYWTTLEEFKEN